MTFAEFAFGLAWLGFGVIIGAFANSYMYRAGLQESANNGDSEQLPDGKWYNIVPEEEWKRAKALSSFTDRIRGVLP